MRLGLGILCALLIACDPAVSDQGAQDRTDGAQETDASDHADAQHPPDAHDQSGTQEDDLTAKAVVELSLPLRELSGLTRRAFDGRIFGVGDDSFSLLSVQPTEPRLQNAVIESIDLAPLFASYTDTTEGSQWEAIASDGDGRVLILEESPGRLFVLDRELQRIERVFELEVEAREGVSSSLAKSWRKNDNARGEGMILLRNGHVLILKERKERALIEFGPAGDAPSGFHLGDDANDVAFPLPAGNKLVALHAWALDRDKAMPDGSELATNLEGELYMLSDEGRAMARVELPIEPSDDEAHLGKPTKLPSLSKPEGMCALDDGAWLIVSDQKTTQRNAIVVPQ